MAKTAADHLWHDRSDYVLALGIGVALPLLRAILDAILFKPIGRRVLMMAKQPKKTDDAVWTADDDVRLYKWKESCWKAVTYLSLSSLAFAAGHTHRWFWDTKLLWTECHSLPCKAPTPPLVRLLYCVEMGYYIQDWLPSLSDSMFHGAQAIPVLMFWEVRRKDFLETFAHHCVTLTLIAYSYSLNLTRVGTMVFLLHDINDIFLESAKMARYAGATALLPDSIFVTFMLTWIASRCIYFPFFIIRSTLFESAAAAKDAGVSLWPHYHLFNAFLIFLFCLHVFWSYLIGRIAARALQGREVDDVREEDD